MKTSVVILSIILTLCVFLPFLYFILNGTKNTVSIKKNINAVLKDSGIIYSLKEIWRKNFIGLSNDHKILTNIYFESGKPVISNINIEDIKQCHVIKNYNYDKKKITGLKDLYLELSFKSTNKPNLIIKFFNVDDDLAEDFELQRIEKWHSLISDAIALKPNLKLAS
ncbi:hypothetical protein ACFSKN_10455 [Mariniflexile gromovii]|uniref:Uncharacterized protein n=1 Tax=Mariniflexile gromovii TaxID=362523 RepID=A0ABS4BYG3_9FLAO|nr:hypothetical protein [Mariniflexile gromovii]MBP0905618.1 hypothetical protein [Mariniflexile gromovii]